MYSQDALAEVEKMLCRYTYNEINELRYCVSRYAIHSKIKKQPISHICKEIVNISYNSLKNRGEDEEKYLEPLVEMVTKGKCPADLY